MIDILPLSHSLLEFVTIGIILFYFVFLTFRLKDLIRKYSDDVNSLPKLSKSIKQDQTEVGIAKRRIEYLSTLLEILRVKSANSYENVANIIQKEVNISKKGFRK